MEARQLMRLGSENRVCVICGESNPARLMLWKGHHLTGKDRDPRFKVVICFNCHHELHDFRAPIAGVKFGKREGPIPARTAARLQAMAVLHEMTAENMSRWADELEGCEANDEHETN